MFTFDIKCHKIISADSVYNINIQINLTFSISRWFLMPSHDLAKWSRESESVVAKYRVSNFSYILCSKSKVMQMRV